MQEPGVGAAEIMNGIRHVRPGGGFEPNMTMFEKTQVNGDSESEIFTFLKDACEYTDGTFSSGVNYSPLRVGDISWNFEKFLIDKFGKPYTRYHPTLLTTDTISADITTLLAA
ncbi:Glutathione peroxidase 3 [Halocaridina rubra]|uniref:glutathione peroxidase n=1 Tax=Halocaridina rubra TaxID=373956 RepID=A0AAN8X286_HALRR